MITLGFYLYYWLYSRTKVINSLHEKPISMILLGSLLTVFVVSSTSSFWGESPPAIIAGLIITLVYLVLYIVTVIKFKNRLQDLLTRAHGQQFKVGGFLSFMFSSIYFQYKINDFNEKS